LEPYLHPGKSAQICSGKKILGVIGELHPLVQQEYDLSQEVYLFELNLEAVFETAGKFRSFTVPSKFPAIERDSALLINAAVEAQQVLDVARKNLGKLGQDIVIFDLYTGKGIPAGKKSIAFRVRYGSPDKTLTEDEVAKAHGKLLKSVCHQLEAEIR
jgi:phenylalanyl-tRNA synthetase beta chain